MPLEVIGLIGSGKSDTSVTACIMLMCREETIDDLIRATCNESRFSPRRKVFFLKLSSAWPEAIVIGSPVARQQALS